MPKLTADDNAALHIAVDALNAMLRKLHTAGHDIGVAVLGHEPIPPAVMPDARPRHLRTTPPRMYVKIVTESTEVGREPSR